MSVFKKYQGKKIDSRHPKYKEASWWMYKRIRGQKPIHKSLPDCLTREHAEQAERSEITRAFNRRYGIADNSTTFFDFSENTYKKYVAQNNVNIKAKEHYINLLQDFFGKKKILSDVSPQDCRDCQYALTVKKNEKGEKLSPSSVNRIMSTASKIFTLACEEGILDRNPMQFVRRLKEPPPRKKLLTEKQKVLFWSELAKDRFLWRIVTLAVNLPLRKGQILAITKNAIDFENNLLWVIKSKNQPPRAVPMNRTAKNVLMELCEIATGEHVFTYPEDAPILEKYRGQPVKDFKRRWSSFLVRAKINEKDGTREDNFHFHDLRKEFASNLIKRNVNPKTIQHLFSHSDMSITDIYLEADLPLMLDAVKSLDDGEVQELNAVG